MVTVSLVVTVSLAGVLVGALLMFFVMRGFVNQANSGYQSQIVFLRQRCDRFTEYFQNKARIQKGGRG